MSQVSSRASVGAERLGFVLLASLLALVFLGRLTAEDRDRSHQWPAWRGPLATGEAPRADPPIRWSEDEGVAWSTALPGVGHASPVVWEDRIYLTTAIPLGEGFPPLPDLAPGAHDNALVTHDHAFVVLAVDRASGRILWKTRVAEARPKEGGHVTGSLASASPVTDGKRVYAFFGSRGLHALDRDGAIEWKVDLGEMQTKHGHGEGASPALHNGTLIVNWDHEGPSSLHAFDAQSGELRWKKARDERTSWATPIIVELEAESGAKARTQVIVSGTNRVRAHDLATGDLIWECGGLSDNVVASPVASDGMVFCGSSYEKQALLAIRLDGASGDITDTDRVAWKRSRATPYVPSFLLYRGSLFFLRHYQGILARVEASTGAERTGPFRLPGMNEIYASPVAAAGRVYVTDRLGRTIVLEDGPGLKRLATNSIGDRVSASLALVDGEIFIRGEKKLWAIGTSSAKTPK